MCFQKIPCDCHQKHCCSWFYRLSFREFIEQEFNLTVGQDIGLCVSLEFLREGSAVQDFMQPDRIVIGSSDKKSENELIELYEVFKSYTIIVCFKHDCRADQVHLQIVFLLH